MGTRADLKGWGSKDDFDKMTPSEKQRFWREICAIFKKFTPNFTGSVKIHIFQGKAKKMNKERTIRLDKNGSE